MQNITLIAALEGTQHKVTTDWFAIMAMLKTREVSEEEVLRIYNELCAGLRISTRGVTLWKVSGDDAEQPLFKS